MYVDKEYLQFKHKKSIKKPIKKPSIVTSIVNIKKAVQQTTSKALTVAKTNVEKQSTTQQQKIEVTPKPNQQKQTNQKTEAKMQPKVECPENSKLNGFLDNIQEILDWIGWIPFAIGDIADGLNVLISFLRGDMLMAVINIACLALPAAIMAGAKKIGKVCSSAVEFVSKLSPEARKLVGSIKGFITGMRDAIGKVIWLVGEKVIRPIMNKLDDFAKWIGEIFSEVVEKVGNNAAENTIKGVSKKGFTDKFIKWLSEGVEETTVYFAKDETGKVLYVGISKQDLEKRLAQHLANDKPFKQAIKPIIEGKTENLTKNQARAIEQYYIEQYGLPNLYNEINSIAGSSEYYNEAKKWATEFLVGK